jgi:hypothetical protein
MLSGPPWNVVSVVSILAKLPTPLVPLTPSGEKKSAREKPTSNAFALAAKSAIPARAAVCAWNSKGFVGPGKKLRNAFSTT